MEKCAESGCMDEKRETVLAVHGDANGYWYIGAGRSIAEGPYRNPDQLLTVASDLLAAEPHWRIDVFDVAGDKIINYTIAEMKTLELDPVRSLSLWAPVSLRSSHCSLYFSPAHPYPPTLPSYL